MIGAADVAAVLRHDNDVYVIGRRLCPAYLWIVAIAGGLSHEGEITGWFKREFGIAGPAMPAFPERLLNDPVLVPKGIAPTSRWAGSIPTR